MFFLLTIAFLDVSRNVIQGVSGLWYALSAPPLSEYPIYEPETTRLSI